MDIEPIELDPAAMRVDPTPGQATATAHSLLDAAASLVCEQGIERLTTTDVARRADVSVGTVYRYFEDREALIRTLCERNVMRMRDGVVDAVMMPRGSPHADIRSVVDAWVLLHRTIPAYQAVRAWRWLLPDARSERATSVGACALDVLTVLAPRHGLHLTSQRRSRLIAAILRTDAILLAAFLDDPVMSEHAVVELRDVAESMLMHAIREATER